jgi:predicted CXXCH cytochrome family protein
MKKVLVLAAAIALFATPALAEVIANSKHNLSTSGAGTIVSTDYDEICVFCHTPHGADTSVSNAPLWNRNTTTVIAELYNSATLDQVNSAPAVVSAAILASDAPLCLSCHDGASLAGNLKNVTNAIGAQPAFGAANAVSGFTNLFDGANSMTNDHPIGMNYAAVQGLDTAGFNAPTGNLVGTLQIPGGVMWCSSCHDVHDNANAPFLAMSNAGSAMCTTCHNK